MSKEKTQGIGFFEKYLTVWVLLCMAAGILVGRFLPGVPAFLERFEYAQVSMPIAVLMIIENNHEHYVSGDTNLPVGTNLLIGLSSKVNSYRGSSPARAICGSADGKTMSIKFGT